MVEQVYRMRVVFVKKWMSSKSVSDDGLLECVTVYFGGPAWLSNNTPSYFDTERRENSDLTVATFALKSSAGCQYIVSSVFGQVSFRVVPK
jgi:hypothetical protein